MGIWGKLASRVTGYLSRTRLYNEMYRPWLAKGMSSTAKVSSAVGKAGAKVISWGSAAKVALVGGAGYLLLSGGLSSKIATVFNIPEWFAQLIIWIVLVLVLIFSVRFIVRWIRRKTGYYSYYRRY